MLAVAYIQATCHWLHAMGDRFDSQVYLYILQSTMYIYQKTDTFFFFNKPIIVHQGNGPLKKFFYDSEQPQSSIWLFYSALFVCFRANGH